MRPLAIVATTTVAVLLSVSSAVASGAHGPTVSVSRNADGTRQILKVEDRSTYADTGSEAWGGFIRRGVTRQDTYRHVDWGG